MLPREHLDRYRKMYPDLWKVVDDLRTSRGKELPWWPDWCYLPMAGMYAILCKVAGADNLSEPKYWPLLVDMSILSALAAWRVTQGIYRFDPDVYREVVQTPITGDIPYEVLFNLPEWCIYIETPGLKFMDHEVSGFFAHLEYDTKNQHKELRLVLDLKNNNLLNPYALNLGKWSLAECIKDTLAEARRNKEQYGANGKRILDEMFTPDTDEKINMLAESFQPVIALLLYLCSANGEIGNGEDRPYKPKPKKTKRGYRLFPPPQPKTWDVGVRMGAAIRKYRAEKKETSGTGEGKGHASPRTHIRRAHWHGYWKGPKASQKRQFILHWLSPILVNPGDKIPVTIHPVE